jgi:hypothetical protein
VRQAQILAEPIVASGHRRCEAAQVTKYEDDLAAMTFEDAFSALRDNEVGELRREPSSIRLVADIGGLSSRV